MFILSRLTLRDFHNLSLIYHLLSTVSENYLNLNICFFLNIPRSFAHVTVLKTFHPVKMPCLSPLMFSSNTPPPLQSSLKLSARSNPHIQSVLFLHPSYSKDHLLLSIRITVFMTQVFYYQVKKAALFTFRFLSVC